MGQKTGFFAPDKLKNHTSEGKGEEKKREEGETFYIGYFSFWHTVTQDSQQCPQIQPGMSISAHWKQDQYKNLSFKVFFISSHLKKTTVTHGVV